MRSRGEAQMEAVLSNNDLLPQILVCLPAKSLIRFKSVSRAWSSLISDSQFCIRHTVHNFSQNLCSVFEFFQQFTSPYPPPMPEPILHFSLHSHRGLTPALINYSKSLHLIHSCNGLFLCKNIENNHYVVYNFTTHNHRLLPHPPSGYYSRRCEGIALAFDPSKSWHYKIIQFRSRKEEFVIFAIDIFSSETGTWKELQSEAPLATSKLVFWNGAVHWIASCHKVHVQFKVDQEKFTCNQVTSFHEYDKIWYFGESNQTLFLIKLHHEGLDDVFTVLEMKQDSTCWEAKHQLDLRPLVTELSHIYERFAYKIWYVKSENEDGELSLLLFNSMQGKFVAYSVSKFNNNDIITQIEGSGKYVYGSSFHFHPLIFSLTPV